MILLRKIRLIEKQMNFLIVIALFLSSCKIFLSDA